MPESAYTSNLDKPLIFDFFGGDGREAGKIQFSAALDKEKGLCQNWRSLFFS